MQMIRKSFDLARRTGYVEAIQHADGQELWLQTDKVPYRDKDGTVIGIVVMARMSPSASWRSRRC